MSTRHIVHIGLNGALSQDRVKRWHVVDVGREQRLLEHVAGVAIIVDEITNLLWDTIPQLDCEFRLAVLRYALYHDAHEPFVGDRPTCAKDHGAKEKYSNNYLEEIYWSSLLEQELAMRIVELADSLEAVRFLARNPYGPHSKEIRHEIDTRVRGCIQSVVAQAELISWQHTNVREGKKIEAELEKIRVMIAEDK